MLAIRLEHDQIYVGGRFSMTLQRTVRLPDDGRSHPLPPGLGSFPVRDLSAFPLTSIHRRFDREFVVPISEREALWLQFQAAAWKPNAVQVAAGGINTVSGASWSDDLTYQPQNYVVCPEQPWLDGVNTGTATVRQFVATAHGRGDTIEEQLTGKAAWGGLQVRVFEPKPGRFPEQSPPDSAASGAYDMPAMGLGAGGTIEQKIYPDPHGLDTWDPANYAEFAIHLLSPRQYESLTGATAPPTPVTASLYARLGLPWFELDDQASGDVQPSERLGKVGSLAVRDRIASGSQPDQTLSIDPSHVVRIKRRSP